MSELKVQISNPEKGRDESGRYWRPRSRYGLTLAAWVMLTWSSVSPKAGTFAATS
ncbi:MAG: hypothetical protein ABI583_15485 [Betaproteobacteria bacterium]